MPAPARARCSTRTTSPRSPAIVCTRRPRCPIRPRCTSLSPGATASGSPGRGERRKIGGMAYVEGRTVHDADSHNIQAARTGVSFGGPGDRGRLGQALVGLTWSAEVQSAVARQRDAAFRARDADEILLRKNQLALGAVASADRPSALDLL